MIKLWVLTQIILPCRASAGDRDPQFKLCIRDCFVERTCDMSRKDSLLWPCAALCERGCAANITAARLHGHREPLQYFGKWSFYSIFGLQEPASTVFSAGNFIIHWNALHSGMLAGPWRWFAVANCNAWLWAVAFHVSDTPLTEALDYGGAVIVLWVFLVASVHHVYSTGPLWLMTAPCIMGLAAHSQFLFPRIDYGNNMCVCVSLTLGSALAWLHHLRRRWSQPHSSHLLTFLLLSALASLLELFDFPPVFGLCDAHSLWHGATIPASHTLYRYLEAERSARHAKAAGDEHGRLTAPD